MALGPHALSDAELLALFIGSGIAGKSAVDVARGLIGAFGSLSKLLNADRAVMLNRGRGGPLPRLLGIGKARYAALQGALELGRRHLRQPLATTSALTTPEATRQFLVAQLRDRPYEVFCCLFLNNRHRLIAFEEMFRGTIDGASVHTREVVRQTMFHNAAALIIAHNHPSGVLEPSMADECVTQRLKQALALVEVRILDHVIVGDGACFSFAEHGLL